MNPGDEQIINKLLSEISISQGLLDHLSLSEFLDDERTARAVAMTLINIREPVKNLSPDLKTSHSDVPWRAISGMRDIAAHKYQTLRKEDVYQTCIEDLPLFYKALLQIHNPASEP